MCNAVAGLAGSAARTCDASDATAHRRPAPSDMPTDRLPVERARTRVNARAWATLRVQTVVRAALALIALFCAHVTPALATEKYAAMVLDANTGKVLHARHGDTPRYPASLTKMMTLYMAFDLIEKKRLSYDSRIRISAQAAAQPPSKLGLEVGSTIRAIDAIKALVTKSANDVAVAVAEHIAGSEANFARLMTEKARELGMVSTVFKNASGLPDSNQVTTARDMITLALALQDHFPQHYGLFKTRRFSYAGKTYTNHNTLLGRVEGVDGIKTGYIRAAGFNLVSSMRRDGKHVVAAVFGGKTARARNATMRALLSSGLKKASTRRTRRAKPLLVATPRKAAPPRQVVRYDAPKSAPLPPQSPLVDVAPKVGRAEPSIEIASVRTVDVLERRQGPARPAEAAAPAYAAAAPPSPAPAPAALPERLPEPAGTPPGRQPSTLQAQLAALLLSSGAVDASAPTGRPAPVERPYGLRGPIPPETRLPSGPYTVQIGAYATQSEAQERLSRVARSEDRLLAGYRQITVPVDTGRQRLFRARFAGFDADSASRTCLELRRRAIDCFVAK